MPNTTNNGSASFDAKMNEWYNMLEGIVWQSLNEVDMDDPLRDDDAVFFWDCKPETGATGQTIETSIIAAAEGQAYSPKGAPDFTGVDSKFYTRFFNKWIDKQYPAQVNRDEARKAASGKGVSANDIAEKIVNSLSQGESQDDFYARRSLLMDSPVPNFSTVIGGVPATMDGAIWAIREAYNYLTSINSGLASGPYASRVRPEDVRIAITDKALNLIDVVRLANVFNLEKDDLLGRIVVVRAGDLPAAQQYRAVVYDRKAMNVAEFTFDYTQDIIGQKRKTLHYLTVSRQYFYNSLFKACAIDLTVAAQSAIATLTEAQTTYTVESTLNDVATLSNTSGTTPANIVYYAEVIPAAGKSLEDLTITVKMGASSAAATDISSDVVAADNSSILIPSATNNIYITIAEG